MTDPVELNDIFGAQGLLATTIPGFAVRSEQAAMAAQVAAAIAAGRTLVLEAGTGVGKTYAYLVPALLAGKRCIISTGTRSLQDQLFSRDLPAIGAALGRPVRVTMLKGRANYLCRYRLEAADTQATARGLRRGLAASLSKVRRWALQTRRGDIAELPSMSEADPIWPWVTSTRDNCLGAQCRDLQRCHVMAARREAQAADIVVVNHHLLVADLLLKEGGFGELLPGAEAVIVDEAHQLPEVAAQAFGFTFSARQLRDFARDLGTELLRGAAFGSEQSLMQTLERLAQDGTEHLGNANEQLEAAAWPADFVEDLHDIQHHLQRFVTATAALADDAATESLRQRALDLSQRCAQLTQSAAAEEPAAVRWAQAARSGFVARYAPVDAATQLGELIVRQGGAWIFTSATLAVGEDFSHFKRRIGLPEATARQYGSPFDFARQAMLLLPADLELPSSPRHTSQVIEIALPLMAASGGRAFLLFTSHRALGEAAELLRQRWADDAPFPLLVQGDAPRDVLLRRFRELGNAVLLGTGSFWEGVDVKGMALSLVVIDKLPFAVPDDPVLKARLAMIERRGGNPFFEEQVPQAVVALKQGVGRLIRDTADFGVVAVCDRRLVGRGYGQIFLKSLPPMRRTDRLEEACAFLAECVARHAPDGRKLTA